MVGKNGGHLASNLGVVELTMALHRVFDSPKDQIVFDVGHQCYPYKLLSGRADRFHTLRQAGGISGFPKRTESEYDSYDTGHAGTSVSACIGLAKARDLLGEKRNVIAYIGDGSAFEMKLITPKSYEDREDVARCLVKGNAVFLNIENLDRDNIIRLMDYLGGVIYVIEGKVKWSNSSSVIFAPKNVNISGIGEEDTVNSSDEDMVDDYN